MLRVVVGIVLWSLAAEPDGRGFIVAWVAVGIVNEGIPAVLAVRLSTLRGHVATAITWLVLWPPLAAVDVVVFALALGFSGVPTLMAASIVAGDTALMATVQGFPIVMPLALWIRAYLWKRRLPAETYSGQVSRLPHDWETAQELSIVGGSGCRVLRGWFRCCRCGGSSCVSELLPRVGRELDLDLVAGSP